MTTTRHGSRGATTYLTAGFVLLVACLLGPTAVRAQWTQPDAANNISNTNTGNVGVGTSAPSFKFEVRGGSSRNTIGVTGDGDGVGYAGIRIGAFTTTNIPNNRTSAFVLSMRKDTWYGGDGSGPSFIIETATKGGGFAAPFLITPTNDIILNSGRGAGGPAGHVPPYGNVGIGTHTPTEKLHVPYRVRFGNILVGESRSGGAEPNGESIEAFGDLVLLSQPGSVIKFGSAGAAPRMLLNSSGNLGIGVASPAFKLDVAGSVNASGLCLGGDCKTAWSQVGGGTTSQWTTSGANIFYSGGNVGVGTSSPAALIDAQRAETGDLLMRLWNTSTASGTTTFRIVSSSNAGGRLQFTDSTAYVATVAADRTGGLRFRTGNTTSEAALGDRITILPDGKVGVATSAPSTRLHVGAEIVDDANRAYDPNALMVVNQTPTATSVLNDPKPVLYLGRQGTSAQAYGAMATFSLSRYENAGTSGVGSRTRLDLGLTHDSFSDAGVMTLLSNGNVGVGTTSPNQTLSVAGTGAFYNSTPVQPSGVRGLFMGNYSMGSGIWSYNYVAGAGDPLNVSAQDISLNTYVSGNGVPRLHVTNAGNVGIGTTTPASKLYVGGGSMAGGPLPGLNVGLGGPSYVSASSGTVNTFLGSDGSPYGIVGTLTNHPLGLRANNTLAVTILPDGRVGVGNSAPVHKLDVTGNVNASGLCLGGDCKTAWSQVGGGGTSQWANGANSSINYGAGNVGIGTTAPAERLEVSGPGEVKTRVVGTLSAGIQFRETTDASTWSEWQQFFDRFRLNTHDGTTTRPDVMSILPNGNVGIGKATPTEALDVVGNIKATGSVSATYQDVAEWVPSEQKLAAGTVVVLDTGKSNHVVASASAYDTKVAGVVSAQPGVILGVGGEGKVMVATTGRVKVKVDATRAPIKVGDLLVTGDAEGVAMRSEPMLVGGRQLHAPGTIIGKALEPLAKGVGEILVLLSLQ